MKEEKIMSEYDERSYEQVEWKINQRPFYQKVRLEIDQLRELDAKLAQALKIAEGSREETLRVIQDARNHVDDELLVATEIWNGRLG
jgi:hypothetical protein